MSFVTGILEAHRDRLMAEEPDSPYCQILDGAIVDQKAADELRVEFESRGKHVIEMDDNDDKIRKQDERIAGLSETTTRNRGLAVAEMRAKK